MALDLEKNWRQKEGVSYGLFSELLFEERKNLRSFEGNTVSCRDRLVEWLCTCGGRSRKLHRQRELFDFCASTMHLAVYLMDLYLDTHAEITEISQMFLVAAISLIVAAKMEEQDRHTPKQFSETISLLPLEFSFTTAECRLAEWNLLSEFNFKLLVPTAPDFLPFLLNCCLIDEEIESTWSVEQENIVLADGRCLNEVKVQISKEATRFCKLSLKDVEFRYFPPSLVALGCVCVGRMASRLQPAWTSHLRDLVDYAEDYVQKCCDMLINLSPTTSTGNYFEAVTVLGHPLMCQRSEQLAALVQSNASFLDAPENPFTSDWLISDAEEISGMVSFAEVAMSTKQVKRRIKADKRKQKRRETKEEQLKNGEPNKKKQRTSAIAKRLYGSIRF